MAEPTFRLGHPSPGPSEPKAIKVFAGIWCPFAHVGLRCVVERRAELRREDVVLHVRAWPLELVNGAPLDPEATARHIQELRAQVAPDLFVGFDPNHFPTTTLPALAWVHAAYEMDVKRGEAVSLALRDALFDDGVDISDPDALASIVRAEGVHSFDATDEQAVLADWREEKKGVKGSPHFFCGDADAFCPSLNIRKDGTGHLEVERNMEVLDAFLERCFTA
jgi:predicted DsbA family dithiol-disulfide isomerase